MKTSVVLLPALLCDATLFAHQIEALKNTYDFFVPEPGPDTDVAAAAKRILAQVPERFILGGISMGGYIAFEILRQAPERAAGVILMDTNERSDPPATKEKRLKMIEKAKENGIEAVISPALLDIILPENRNDANRHLLSQMASAIGIEKYINEQTLIMNRPDSSSLLSKISCPALIMGGEKDFLSPPEAMKGMAAQIPDGTHIIIKNSAHLPPIENPDAVTAAWRLFFQKILL